MQKNGWQPYVIGSSIQGKIEMMGYRTLAALTLPVAFSVQAVHAADLPTHKAPPPAVYVGPYDPWTGFFLGLQGGYGWDGEQVTVPYVSWVPYGVERHGGFAGLVGGYDYRFANNVVVGVEADYNLANISGGAAIDRTYLETNKVNNFGSIDLKLGYAIDRLLIYGLGGIGFLDVNHTIDAPLIPFAYGSWTKFQTAYNVGGGVQYAFTNNWSGFLEYRYYNTGSKDFPAIPVLGWHKTVESLSNVRVGIAYRFGG